ncbi:MAG TPA: endonuclease/exonuclease/phosphatase family protein [Solirubrobacterales bacterium]|nr:endonuclease/exonuclease/phosphatase family protein [Solirubrobacterales bacterium]
MEIGVITWNLFHGRDAPPNPALFTWRSRILRRTERNHAHVQVNRDLSAAFFEFLAGMAWDVALLQECPPRWAGGLAKACDAAGYVSLTSRNWLGAVFRPIARRNPDLLGSWEGGSNQILVRAEGAGEIREGRDLLLRRPPERRTMAFVRLASGVCAATLHASQSPPLAEADMRRAASAAVEWAEGAPLILGGDFNLRPARTSVFDELEERLDLRRPTGPQSIDHILGRGLEILEGPSAWAPEKRDMPFDGRALRLSDHSPVTARFRAVVRPG